MGWELLLEGSSLSLYALAQLLGVPCSPLVPLQATSRRLSQEKKILNLWPHSSATAALPKPGETLVPSAEVGKNHTQSLPYDVRGG